MNKDIDIIIVGQTVSEGFYVTMRGHYPNEKFKSVVSDRMATYKEAYSFSGRIVNILSLLGHKVRLLNDKSAKDAGSQYCDLMAFVPVETDID